MSSSDSSLSMVSSRDSHFTSSPCNLRDIDLNDFDSGDACRLLLQLKRKGLDETLISLLETIIEMSRAEMTVARTGINSLHSQIDTLSAQVEFLMERRETEDTALRLVNAARRVIVRGFQILFPKVYTDDDVYFQSNQDGGVNWSGFKDLIREHEKLLKTGCLSNWSRLADRQSEILDAYQAESEDGSSLNSTAASVVEGVQGKTRRAEAHIGNYHVEEHIKGNFSYLLPHCESRVVAMDKLRGPADEYLEDIFNIFNDAKSIPDLIRQLQANLQDAEERLSALQNPIDKVGDGESVNAHGTDQSDNTLENDPYGGAPMKDVLILRKDSMSNRLKKVLDAQKVVLDTSGLNGWVVQTTLLIMKSDAVGLIDDPLYGLSRDGSKFLETTYTTRSVPLSKEMLHSTPSRDDVARSLESILTRTTDDTVEANGRPP